MVPTLPMWLQASWLSTEVQQSREVCHSAQEFDPYATGFWRERFRIAAYSATCFLSDLGKLQDG